MSGEFEAAGAMATAGLAAGAIEGREPGGGREGPCLNCGAQLQGRFCHACGQAAHAHRTLGHVFEEFLHGIIHFDTKAWRTLPMVAFRPGTLTRNYIYGKRARYISPLALFLFTVFFMFAVFAFTGDAQPGLQITETATREEAVAALTEARQEVAVAEAELARAIANPSSDQPEGLEERLARVDVRLAEQAVGRAERTLRVIDAVLAQRAAAGQSVGADTTVAHELDQSDVNWQDFFRQVAENEDFVVVRGWDDLNHKVREKMRNPDLALYKIQQAAYKFSFLLIPISLPFIALLFLWKRGVTLYDHVVYTLYGLSFVSILFVLVVTVANYEATRWLAPSLVMLGIPTHTYFHLKGAYALGWFSALWRTFFMLVFASIALTLFLLAIIVLGFVG